MVAEVPSGVKSAVEGEPKMGGPLIVADEVQDALAEGRPVVALESTLVAHGLPRPTNLETAHALERDVRAAGGVPATIGVLDGALVVGLDAEQLERLAMSDSVRKLSRADLAHAIATRSLGATTVAATMVAAHRAGIAFFATGGIGGVHRDGERSMDVSADLTELSRTPVCVVAAGAKSILDLPRTLEVLETHGVPVIGYGTDELPAFFSRSSGLALTQRVDGAREAASVVHAQRALGLETGILLAVPPPDSGLVPGEIDRAIGDALARAAAEGVAGKQVTPFLLAEIRRQTGGRSLDANVALVLHNARTATEVAVAYAQLATRAR
jgi:pseudouridine-5'-phosphate glycosidase